jgi:NAD(P)-dependent dehydrogenase (short-subunit alcohol dehydrogenase family)
MSATMAGKTCVITGANTGIGRATAEELARQGATVVMICRSRERGEAARAEIAKATGNQSVELVLADLAEMKDVRRAADEIKAKHAKIHVLINNAAVFLPRREVTSDGLEKTFATNYLSHFLLTHLLLDALKKGAPSRVINVATKTTGLKMNLDDLQLTKGYSIMNAVGPTKLGLILFTQELATRLQGTGVTVNALHPGLVKTPLLDDVPWLMRTLFHLFSGSPQKGARTPVYLATSPDVAGVSGKLFADCKEVKAGGAAADPALQSKLWEISSALARVNAAS